MPNHTMCRRQTHIYAAKRPACVTRVVLSGATPQITSIAAPDGLGNPTHRYGTAAVAGVRTGMGGGTVSRHYSTVRRITTCVWQRGETSGPRGFLQCVINPNCDRVCGGVRDVIDLIDDQLQFGETGSKTA